MSESGKTRETKGRVKEAAGALSGNDDLKAEGRGDQTAGKAQQAGEKIRDAAGDLKDALKK